MAAPPTRTDPVPALVVGSVTAVCGAVVLGLGLQHALGPPPMVACAQEPCIQPSRHLSSIVLLLLGGGALVLGAVGVLATARRGRAAAVPAAALLLLVLAVTTVASLLPQVAGPSGAGTGMEPGWTPGRAVGSDALAGATLVLALAGAGHLTLASGVALRSRSGRGPGRVPAAIAAGLLLLLLAARGATILPLLVASLHHLGTGHVVSVASHTVPLWQADLRAAALLAPGLLLDALALVLLTTAGRGRGSSALVTSAATQALSLLIPVVVLAAVWVADVPRSTPVEGSLPTVLLTVPLLLASSSLTTLAALRSRTAARTDPEAPCP